MATVRTEPSTHMAGLIRILGVAPPPTEPLSDALNNARPKSLFDSRVVPLTFCAYFGTCLPAGWSRWLELQHHLHDRISQERLMNLRLTGPCQPLGEGGQSSAYILHARLSALGAHTCILRCFGKALAACGAMRARMARSRSALCGTPRLHCV